MQTKDYEGKYLVSLRTCFTKIDIKIYNMTRVEEDDYEYSFDMGYDDEDGWWRGNVEFVKQYEESFCLSQDEFTIFYIVDKENIDETIRNYKLELYERKITLEEKQIKNHQHHIDVMKEERNYLLSSAFEKE